MALSVSHSGETIADMGNVQHTCRKLNSIDYNTPCIRDGDILNWIFKNGQTTYEKNITTMPEEAYFSKAADDMKEPDWKRIDQKRKEQAKKNAQK